MNRIQHIRRMAGVLAGLACARGFPTGGTASGQRKTHQYTG